MRLKVCFWYVGKVCMLFSLVHIHTLGYYYNFNMISDSTSFWYFYILFAWVFPFFFSWVGSRAMGTCYLVFTLFWTGVGLWNVGVECVNSIWEEECDLFCSMKKSLNMRELKIWRYDGSNRKIVRMSFCRVGEFWELKIWQHDAFNW
jgi:hypothetical protein